MSDQWLADRAAYIRGLKKPSEQQQLLLELYDKGSLNDDEQRQLKALMRAEKAAQRAVEARGKAAKVVNAKKEADRQARNHELYNAAGLMILAGLVDTKTGKPTWDKAELVGALASMADADIDDDKRREWRARGTRILAADRKNHG